MRPFLLIWALLTSVGLFQPAPTSFTVGVLRRDALIVPFATYDGRRWKNGWPAPADNLDVPLGLRNVPAAWWGPPGARETWQIWTSAASPQIVKVRQPDWAPSYCQKQIGLRTDYQPRVRPPRSGTSPYPKDGLAVSPPHAVEPIEVIPPGSPERDDVTEIIHRRFVEQEKVAVRQMLTQQPNLLAMPPMAIEALYAYGSSRRTYFVEAARDYRKAGSTCWLMAFGTGRVVRESGKLSVESADVSIHTCNRDDVVYMLPLGVITVPTGVYFIAQSSGWNREAYRIIDITPHSRTADLVTQGGGCY